jgi:starch-binding outer membrane protein, SusD/RagB family
MRPASPMSKDTTTPMAANTSRDGRLAPPRGRWVLVPVVVLAALLAACNTDEIIKVEDPDVVTPGVLGGAAALPTLRAGAESDFQVAFSGTGDGSEGQINMTGLFADEFFNSETFPTRLEVDGRRITDRNSTMETIFRDLSRARTSAERAVAAYAEFSPAEVPHAEVLNLAGFSYIMFGENYCSGVPFSTVTATGAEFGPPLSTEEMFTQATARFDEALAIASAAAANAENSPDVVAAAEQHVLLAQVGRGRALLNLGQYADAAAAVAGVPDDFVYLIEHSDNTPRQWNGVWELTYNEGRWTVADREGGTGLPFQSEGDVAGEVQDPRVANALSPDEVGFDNATPLYLSTKYPDRGSNAVLASGVEARLIEAEAALHGAGGDFLAGINAARAQFGLAPVLAAPATAVEQQDLLFRERAYDLFLSGHRLADLRRLVRQYQRNPESIFPTGVYPNGKIDAYGNQVSFPVPVQEQNNPNFTGCDATQA